MGGDGDMDRANAWGVMDGRTQHDQMLNPSFHVATIQGFTSPSQSNVALMPLPSSQLDFSWALLGLLIVSLPLKPLLESYLFLI